MGPQLKTVKPKIAFVVVAFNDLSNLKRLWPSLKKELKDQRYESHLLIIDNSTDQQEKRAIKDFIKFNKQHYFDPGKNTGFAKGNNLALAKEFAGPAEYCLLLNSDTEIKDGSLHALVKAQQETAAALVGPKILYGSDRKTFWYGGGRWQPWLGIVRHNYRNKPIRTQQRQPVTFVNGAAMLIPKSTYLKYGGFFEPYFMYYEDSDFSAQLAAQKEIMIYEPKAVVYHFVPPVTEKSAFSIYYLTRNHWLFWVRNSRGLARLTSFIAICTFQLLRFLVNITNQPRRNAILKAWQAAFKRQYGKTYSS